MIRYDVILYDMILYYVMLCYIILVKGFATAADTPVAVGVVIFIVMWLWNLSLPS